MKGTTIISNSKWNWDLPMSLRIWNGMRIWSLGIQGFAHEFKNSGWKGDLTMSLRTWNGMGDLPMSLRTRNGNGICQQVLQLEME